MYAMDAARRASSPRTMQHLGAASTRQIDESTESLTKFQLESAFAGMCICADYSFSLGKE